MEHLSSFHFISWWDYAELALALHVTLLIVLAIRILFVQRNTSVAIAWLAILVALPVIGIIAYLLIGEPMIGRRYQQRSRQARQLLGEMAERERLIFDEGHELLPKSFQGVSRIGARWTGFGVYEHNQMQLLTQSDEIFDHLIHDIESAKRLLLMEFYIVYPKGRVLEIFDALKAAAARGVECHLLADSVGSYSFFSGEYHKELSDAGIYVHQSLPVGLFKTLFKRTDLRNHRKIAVFDEQVGYTGSFNLVDPRFFKQDKDVGQWIDVMMRITSSDSVNIVTAMAKVVATDIGAESENNLTALQQNLNHYTRKFYTMRPAINDVNQKAYVLNQQKDMTQEASVDMPKFSVKSNVLAQLIPSAPQMTAHVIYDTLTTVIYRANHYIQITTPYFVPDDALLAALVTAAKRGVKVVLIVPKKVDSFLAQHASEAYYQSLLEAGVNIALFDGGLLHTKTVVIDESYCLFGTVNMDMRSFYLNMEVSLAIYTPEMVAQIVKCQEAYLKHCEFLSKEDWNQRRPYQRLLANSVRLLSPLL